MSREQWKATPPAERPEEKYVEIRVPESTYHLFNCVMEHPVLEDPAEHRAYMERNMALNTELYPLPEEFTEHGAPKGRLLPGTLEDSLFYPGVKHDYWLYVPAQYDGSEPASFLLVYDGGFEVLDRETGRQLPQVAVATMLDNLIAEGKLPVTIALFAHFGVPGPGQPVFGFNEGVVNRSLEYDTASDWHARYVTEELMPHALKGWKISADPEDHAVCGMSSSGIAAFTTAWFKPDVFRKVYNASPSFADIRFGIIWPYAIRMQDKRPLKVYTVTGKRDLDIVFGSWPNGSYDVSCALRWRGYEHQAYWSEAGHNRRVYTRMMSPALQWLFRDAPTEVPHIEPVAYPDPT